MFKSVALLDLSDWSLAPNLSFSEFDFESFRRQSHFQLQVGGRPNVSFSKFDLRIRRQVRGFGEFQRRISASGTSSASAWGQTEFKPQRIPPPNSASGTFSASGWGQTEFAEANLCVSLASARIQASANSNAEFLRQAHSRLQAGSRPNLSFSKFERRISA